MSWSWDRLLSGVTASAHCKLIMSLMLATRDFFQEQFWSCVLARQKQGYGNLGYIAGIWVGLSFSASQHQPSRLV